MRFGGVLAVNNVNFNLRERELRCLIGPNGAGKSTLFKCITGLHQINHSNGRVFIRGHDVTGWRPHEIVQIGLVLCQRPKLVLLDEPAAGITGAEADRLVELIHDINQQAAVVVVDHDMNFVRMLGGTVTVLHQGAVLMEGATDAVMNNAKVREVYIGNRAK